ncbi:MAG: hypothetical protein ACYDDU_17165 [Dermatophilaceae bacterium]
MTTEDVRGWPALLPAQLADDVLGISYATGKRLRLAGEYPLPVLMIGRLNKVRRSDLLELLEPTAGLAQPVRLEAVS